jgi:hypothetical protein
LPAPTMSHIICIGALVTLIFVMPLFYFSVIDNVDVEMMERELKEVADYVSNSLGNLYLLANSTDCDILLKKRLDLPSSVRDSTYCVEIVYNHTDGFAQYVKAYSKDSSGIRADSLIFPGPKVDNETGYVIESGDKIVIAGCSSNSTGTYVWITEEQ